jgi:SAM-dependent methyltransferase
MSGFANSARNMLFMYPRDIALFLRSARTDAAIAGMRATLGEAAAFDSVYDSGDPWASADPRYRYQRRKYDVLAGLLPENRNFERAIDLGAGLGLMSRRLASRADEVVGLDISTSAVLQANAAYADLPNLRFIQGDVTNLPTSLTGNFDLVVVADTLYYLPPPLLDDTLQGLATSIAGLLRPGGLCLIANHFFMGMDRDSRLSRRIHRAFAACPLLRLSSDHRRPFYLVSLLDRVG